MPEAAPLVLWQMGPGWGMSSLSPFCIKLEAWLRMAGLPYVVKVVQGLPRSRSGKVPYVEHADGRISSDSHGIIATLTAEHHVALDDGLDASSRALALSLTRLLEDHFYWAVVWDRWVTRAHWATTRVAYFGALPWPLRGLVAPLARRGVRRALHGQGFGRMCDAEILARARLDLNALSDVLGTRDHVLGRPSSLDATAFAFLVSAARPPFDGPLQRLVAGYSNLTAFCEHFEREWW